MSTNFTSLHSVMMVLLFVVRFLGAPVAWHDPNAAVVTGFIGLALFVGLASACWQRRAEPGFIFPFLMGLNAIADAMIVSLGRAAFGTEQALAWRYGTVSAPLWAAILLLPLLTSSRAARSLDISRAAATAGVLVLCALLVRSGEAGAAAAAAHMSQLRSLRIALTQAWDWPTVARLYVPDLPKVKERVATMRMLHVSVFREE